MVCGDGCVWCVLLCEDDFVVGVVWICGVVVLGSWGGCVVVYGWLGEEFVGWWYGWCGCWCVCVGGCVMMSLMIFDLMC